MNKLQNHSSSWPFLKPVDKREVPDYYDVIKDPIGESFYHFSILNLALKSFDSDLETIEKRVKRGNYYIAKEIFLADVKRMCENCRLYNREDTEYFKCANDIENEFVKRGRHFRKLEDEK